MSPVERGHLAAALKCSGSDNQVVITGMPLSPRSGEPASSDGKVFVPGPRFLSGKLCFVHCFRQVPPGANSPTLRYQPGKRLSILQQHKRGVLIMLSVHTVGKIPGCFRDGDRRFLHTIRLSEFTDISI